jgi:hemerythrin-like metal-binding protein
MDQSHRIVFELLEAMQHLPRPAFDDACRQLASELTEDLIEENRLMRSIDYAAALVHQTAHDSLLEAIDQAQCLLADGDEVRARAIVSTLPNWVEAHINTMDLALAVEVTRFKERPRSRACDRGAEIA